MASIMQILRRIGGLKASPTSGSAGQLAIWKAGSNPTDAFALYLHDGVQWVEALGSPGGNAVVPHLATSEAAPANPTPGAFWYRPSTKEVAAWDGVQWANVAFKNLTNTFVKAQVIDITDAAAALHVTQQGTGSALHVSTPGHNDVLVANNAGHVGFGRSDPLAAVDVNGTASCNTNGTTGVMDLNVGQSFSCDATAGVTFSFANVPAGRATTVVLRLWNGGAKPQVWPASVKWLGGAPTLTANKAQIIVFYTDDGGAVWHGNLAGEA